VRAIDDPVKLARAGRIMKRAIDRDAKRDRWVDDQITKLRDLLPPIPSRADLATIPVPAVDDMIRIAVDAAPDLPADLAQRLTELIRAAPVRPAQDPHIAELVASWPPLSPEQRAKLSALLAPSTADVAAKPKAVKPPRHRRTQRKHPADIAADMIREATVKSRMERAARVSDDRKTRQIQQIMERCGVSFADALANWNAIEEGRRLSLGDRIGGDMADEDEDGQP
jgi:hypothetical protein